MSDFFVSIITCTYNPSEDVFYRVLRAVAQLNRTGIETEYVIIDNNSKQPVASLSYVAAFLKENSWARVIVENEPGLTAARICGYTNTRHEVLLFVDDDVELAADYLQNIASLFKNYPQVGAWNAGSIEVDYIEKPEAWFLTKGKAYFQQSAIQENCWGNSRVPAPYTPFGTGLCIKRDAFALYADKVKNKDYNLTDRVGGKMSSGGDSQMVLCAIALNYNVGRSPFLKLHHLVSPAKATVDYVVNLSFGLAYSFQVFKKEAVPEVYKPLNQFGSVIKVIIHNTLHLLPGFDFKSYRAVIADRLGIALADYRMQNRKTPVWLKMSFFIFGIKAKGY
jgi:glycosyltransferase involved in cell wall biosynthesis